MDGGEGAEAPAVAEEGAGAPLRLRGGGRTKLPAAKRKRAGDDAGSLPAPAAPGGGDAAAAAAAGQEPAFHVGQAVEVRERAAALGCTFAGRLMLLAPPSSAS